MKTYIKRTLSCPLSLHTAWFILCVNKVVWGIYSKCVHKKCPHPANITKTPTQTESSPHCGHCNTYVSWIWLNKVTICWKVESHEETVKKEYWNVMQSLVWVDFSVKYWGRPTLQTAASTCCRPYGICLMGLLNYKCTVAVDTMVKHNYSDLSSLQFPATSMNLVKSNSREKSSPDSLAVTQM